MPTEQLRIEEWSASIDWAGHSQPHLISLAEAGGRSLQKHIIKPDERSNLAIESLLAQQAWIKDALEITLLAPGAAVFEVLQHPSLHKSPEVAQTTGVMIHLNANAGVHLVAWV